MIQIRPTRKVSPHWQRIRWAILALSLPVLGACASLMASAIDGMAADLSTSIMNQRDPKIVEDGAPSYLLLVDSLTHSNPKNVKLHLTAASLYGAYTSVFIKDDVRAKLHSSKARDFGRHALCLRQKQLCRVIAAPYDEFVPQLQGLGRSDVPVLFGFASSWAGWIQTHQDDWNAIADLAKVEACMQRVVELDEGYDQGAAHLYLGVINTLLPPALGGKPEVGRGHFERAIALSQGKNLLIKVQFAEKYARLVFDRELHDRLLNEVLQAEVEAPGFTLLNTLAKQQAEQLLATANDYF